MRRQWAFAAIIVALGLSSCSKQGNWLETARILDGDVAGGMQHLPLPADSIGTVFQTLVVEDDLLWSESEDVVVKAYNFKDNSLKRIPVRKGRSEQEVLNVHQIVPSYNPPGAGVVDPFQSKVVQVCKDRGEWVITDVLPAQDYSSVTITEEGGLVGTLSSGQRYAWENGSGRQCFGDYKEWDMSVETAWNMLQGLVVSHKDKMAWFAYYQAAYQIVDYKTQSVVSTSILDAPEFSSDSGTAVLTKDSKVGFISVCVSGEDIYALYDGKTLEHYIYNKSKPYGNDIIKIDWQGRIIGRYHSSLPIFSVSAYGESLILSATDDEGLFYFGEYDLS